MTKCKLKAQFPKGLYTITGLDWSLVIHASVTEPYCPAARLVPDTGEEDEHFTRWTAIADTIEQAVQKLAAVVEQDIKGDGKARGGLPFSNPGDAKFDHWLAQWRQGIPYYDQRFSRNPT